MKRFTTILATAAVATLAAAPAMAHEEGTWILRAGVGTVDPESNNLVLRDFPAAALNTTIEVDDGTSLTLTGTYMFTRNWAFDILAAWPFSHDIDAKIVDTQAPGGASSLAIGETDHLPPTFSVQYHFIPDGKFQPYFGLGLNYTTFFSTDVDQELTDALGVTRLSLDDSFGLAAQLGADIELNDDWVINLDFRYINIESDVSANGAKLGTVDINPYVYSISVGKRF
ncbi:MAG: OmpW family outer membrane protein [Woeseiaceae bacterium]|nr:OmpW family outer membrane protein [Woeseiaceae bacterium]